jgi:hypothetical protein
MCSVRISLREYFIICVNLTGNFLVMGNSLILNVLPITGRNIIADSAISNEEMRGGLSASGNNHSARTPLILCGL